MQQKQTQLNVLSERINSKIRQMFKKHLVKVENMNQEKAFGGKNSKHDKNDKVYRDIVQLKAKINQGIFTAILQSQCLRKQRKQFFQNKIGKFVQILTQLHEKKNVKIKLNENIQKMIMQANTAAQQTTSLLKKYQKQGNGWCGRTSDFKIPLEKALLSLCEYSFVFQNLSKFESITNDSVKEIFLPVQYSQKDFSFEKQLIQLWPKPVIQKVQVVKEIIKDQPKTTSEVSRMDEAHQLFFGFTRPQQPYKAIKIYEQQAKKSISKVSACNALGTIYEAGKYVQRDLKKSLKYYKEAQKMNSAQALHKIGMFLEKGLVNSKQQFQGKYPNREAQIRAAIDYHQRAAKLGHLDAITDLGFIYENGIKNQFGDDVVQAYPQHAVDYYKKAKKEQFPRALNNLGSFLIKNDKSISQLKGQTVEKGIRYLTRAKQLKYPKAFLNLGKCYENGIGVLQSVDMARACYLQGIQAGEPSCKMEYIRTYLSQKIDDNKILIKLAQLCRQVLLKDHTNPEANYFMGLFCQKGIGTQKNKESTFYYIEKAARRNHPAALVKLGDFYYSGYHVDKNLDYAKKLYDMARQKGNTQALVNIGLMKQKGYIDDNMQLTPDKVYEGAARLGNANGVLYSGLSKGHQHERQALIKAAQMGSLEAVDLLKRTEPLWIPKKQKQNITHSEWMYRNTRPLVEPILNLNNLSNRPSSRISMPKKQRVDTK